MQIKGGACLSLKKACPPVGGGKKSTLFCNLAIHEFLGKGKGGLLSNFRFSQSVLPVMILQKWPALMQISWTNYLFQMNVQFFCKTGFILISKWWRILCKKSHFMQNHSTVAKENWLFPGNPSSKHLKSQYL